jgi:hypothetical protein
VFQVPQWRHQDDPVAGMLLEHFGMSLEYVLLVGLVVVVIQCPKVESSGQAIASGRQHSALVHNCSTRQNGLEFAMVPSWYQMRLFRVAAKHNSTTQLLLPVPTGKQKQPFFKLMNN